MLIILYFYEKSTSKTKSECKEKIELMVDDNINIDEIYSFKVLQTLEIEKENNIIGLQFEVNKNGLNNEIKAFYIHVNFHCEILKFFIFLIESRYDYENKNLESIVLHLLNHITHEIKQKEGYSYAFINTKNFLLKQNKPLKNIESYQEVECSQDNQGIYEIYKLCNFFLNGLSDNKNEYINIIFSNHCNDNNSSFFKRMDFFDGNIYFDTLKPIIIYSNMSEKELNTKIIKSLEDLEKYISHDDTIKLKPNKISKDIYIINDEGIPKNIPTEYFYQTKDIVCSIIKHKIRSIYKTKKNIIKDIYPDDDDYDNDDDDDNDDNDDKENTYQVFDVNDILKIKSRIKSLSRDDAKKTEDLIKNLKNKSSHKKITYLSKHWRTICDQLETEFPNFKQVVDFIRSQMALGSIGNNHLKIPPILLLGEPGVGKTEFMLTLTDRLNTTLNIVDMSSIKTASKLSGSENFWSNSKPGAVFDTLALGDYANPLIMLDEIDKCVSQQSNPLSALHSLLEKRTAKTFKDLACPDLILDASIINWIATANNKHFIEVSILDRFNVFEILPPNKKQMNIIVKNQYKTFIDTNESGYFFNNNINDEVLSLLSQQPPRCVRKLLEISFGLAALDESPKIEIPHIHQSLNTLFKKTSIGF